MIFFFLNEFYIIFLILKIEDSWSKEALSLDTLQTFSVFITSAYSISIKMANLFQWQPELQGQRRNK